MKLVHIFNVLVGNLVHGFPDLEIFYNIRTLYIQLKYFTKILIFLRKNV